MRTKVGIVFDDGFIKSSLKTAELYEEFGIRAVFAVLADPTVNFVPGCGDWKLWNELQKRGHIIQPHGYTHANLRNVTHEEGVQLVDRALKSFEDNLEGFKAKDCIYCFTYNLSTPRLVEYLLPKVRAVRHGGSAFLTDADLKARVWHSTTFGPEDPAGDFEKHLDRAKEIEAKALFYVPHGIDGEYWGAMKLESLRRILDRIVNGEDFEYWPLT